MVEKKKKEQEGKENYNCRKTEESREKMQLNGWRL